MTTVLKEKYAGKIVGLLRKAEGGTTPEEAELLLAKAQELMTKYAIEQALLNEVLGQEDDPIEQIQLVYTGFLRRALAKIGWAVLRANECKGIYHEWGTFTDVNGRTWKQCYFLTVTGFRHDLERVRMLDTSLQLQAALAVAAWWKAGATERSLYTYSKLQTHRERRNFVRGFAFRISDRLNQAAMSAEKQIADEEAIRKSTSHAEASESIALVLRNRRDRVQDWYDECYGRTLRTYRRRGEGGSNSSWLSGEAAGDRADIGQPGIDGGSKELRSNL